RVGRFVYYLNLLKSIKIYLVVSAVYLLFVSDGKDVFNYDLPPPGLVEDS
ncbi:hypothetical protein QR685DRAFT_443510, partial [Neurospora intermedia]